MRHPARGFRAPNKALAKIATRVLANERELFRNSATR